VPEHEQPLTGGRVTPGVVRIGETVRRPLRGNSEFVRRLLEHLEAAGFEGAPRYLGSDEAGREMFSFVPGIVPDELDATLSDDTLVAAAGLIRRFHDATEGSALAGSQEVVCHGDLSPCNFVFDRGKPVAMIDFDAAAPGSRLDDLGYALFLWLNLGTDGPPAREQARRIRLFCHAYGCEATSRIVQAVVDAVTLTLDRLAADAVPWWREQRRWLEENRDSLV
jgi:Ser/Thr protein kinase RdoA (MazF antagonist)